MCDGMRNGIGRRRFACTAELQRGTSIDGLDTSHHRLVDGTTGQDTGGLEGSTTTLGSCYRACSFTLLLLNSFILLSPTLTSFVLYPFLSICLFPFLICFPLTHLCLLCLSLTHSLYLSIFIAVT